MERSARGDEAPRQEPARQELTPAHIAHIARCALFAIGALPWLIPLAQRVPSLARVSDALATLFVPFCHRIPERTLALFGAPMPVCSRCAGIFAGLALGALIAWPRVAAARWRALAAAAGALMALDGITQTLGLHPTWHAARAATGLPFGYAVAAAITALTQNSGPPT